MWRKKVRRRALFLALVGFGAGCASGPVELLDELEAEVASCGSGARCAADGIEAVQAQDFSSAMAFFHRGCRLGEVLACRRLGDGYARGDGGVVDLEVAGKLYGWSCVEGDGPACHSLGELERLRAGQGDMQRAKRAFERACQVGEPTGCHDLALLNLREGGDEPRSQEEAAQVFEELCVAGLWPACTNFAYLLAIGRGVARDQSRALALFEKACRGAREWQAHPLAPLASGGSADEEPELFTMSQFDAEAPCGQLEVLATGSFEERVIAAFAAEQADLISCYEGIRQSDKSDKEQVGRITVQAKVGVDGDGEGLEIAADTLGEEAVASCVEQAMRRHLVDGAAGEGRFLVDFDLSFIHSPTRQNDEDEEVGCDPKEVRRALEEASAPIQSCGRRYLEEPQGAPGVVMARWSFGGDGQLQNLKMISTLEDRPTLQCLRSTLEEMEIESFDSGGCPVQAPFVFTRGDRLHFTVILR